MADLLYPAYQKFYSALKHLEMFNKESDFFSNISNLDSFFSEYRNITFVIQKALAHTRFMESYEKNRDIYLKDHWFVDMRNDVVKKHPVKLIKAVYIAIYFPDGEISLVEQNYTVDEDSLNDLISEIKELFDDTSCEEIFFSANYSFFLEGTDFNLLNRIESGIDSIGKLLIALEEDINEESNLCKKLKKQIADLRIRIELKSQLLADDYVYYKATGKFERAVLTIMALANEHGKVANRSPLSSIKRMASSDEYMSPFQYFTMMHMIPCSMGGSIMPAIMTIYDDDTFDLEAFQSSIKTTIYRKINEVAKVVLAQSVKKVFVAFIYSSIPLSDQLSALSKERLMNSTCDYLVCACVTSELSEREYCFEINKLNEPMYKEKVFTCGMAGKLYYSARNLTPIKKAFSSRMNV